MLCDCCDQRHANSGRICCHDPPEISGPLRVAPGGTLKRVSLLFVVALTGIEPVFKP